MRSCGIPRFREYLLRRLHDEDDARARTSYRAYGRLLVAERRHDEAVTAFLQAGDVPAAEEAGEVAVAGVLRRRDFAVAERWLGAFRPATIAASQALSRAELAIAVEQEAWVTGAEIADRLLDMLGPGTTLDTGTAGAMATCYAHVGRLDDTASVIDRAAPGAERDAWRFVLGVGVAAGRGPQHYERRPADQDSAIDGFLARIDVSQGRFARLLEPRSVPWAAARSSLIAARIAVGRLDEALAMFEETPGTDRSPSMLRLQAELMAALGRADDAWRAVDRGERLLERSGSLTTMLHHLTVATLALRLAGDPDRGDRALDRVEAEPTAGSRLRIVEQLHLWRGLGALLRDEAPRARHRLERAVSVMDEWDRLYYLPIAAVYLAEAAWRVGDEDAADDAADRALDAARRQGSDHLLLGALREFPSVLSRRLDAVRGSDSRWHRVGRALVADGTIAVSGLLPRTHVRELGPEAVLVDDRVVHPKLTRSVEVLAYLAAHDGRVARAAMLDDLFDGRVDDSARAYLRQALSRLRDALPADAPLQVDADEVRWNDPHLTSDSTRFQREVRQALHLHGRPGFESGLAALWMLDAGPYLPGARSRWSTERRELLARLADDTRQSVAQAAFELGELEHAEDQVDRLLVGDPFRETAWRLAMQIAAAVGDDDRVIARFKGCRDALADLRVEPSTATRGLFEQLRR